jgi:hypothetical protein
MGGLPSRVEHSTAAASAMRHVSPQEAAALLGRPRPMLNERQRQIVDFLKRIPAFATMRRLLLSFRSIRVAARFPLYGGARSTRRLPGSPPLLVWCGN